MKAKLKKSLLISLFVVLIGAVICLAFARSSQNNVAYAEDGQVVAVQADDAASGEGEKDDAPDLGWAIITAAAVDVVLVVLLVVQLARKDKKKKGEEKLNALGFLPLLAMGSLSATSQFVIIGILAAAALGLLAGNIAMLVLAKKSKNQIEESATENLTEEQPADEENEEALITVSEVIAEEIKEEPVEEVAEEQPEQVEEPVEEIAEEQPEAVEVVEEKPVEVVEEKKQVEAVSVQPVADEDENDAPESEEDEDEETEVLRGVEESTGLAIVVRYKKSFLAKLIQSSDETKGYYSTLKNELLSYNKVKSRISWNYDSINYGRVKLAKFVMRGKTLCLYLALNPDDYAETNIKVERSESKKFEEVPCLYRIKNPRRATLAIDLIVDLAVKYGIEKGEQQNEDYYMPYEATEPLVERGLIKELISKENYEEFMRRRSLKAIDKNRRQFVSAAEVNSIIEDEVAITLVETEEPATAVAAEKKRYRKKSIVNIDSLSKNFNAGETVNIQTLKERGILAKDVDFIKVLARGTLDKPLKVEAQDYSVEAIKMILLTGGHVKKVI